LTYDSRGASGSAGSTSWTGRAELADYVSFMAFLLCFATYVSHERVGQEQANDVLVPLLVIGGYSYGSLMASRVPAVDTILDLIRTNRPDTSEHEIKERAKHLAQDFCNMLRMQSSTGSAQRGRMDLRIVDGTASPSRGIAAGGYESEAASRRISRESSRKSIDVERFRQSIDRVRHTLGKRSFSHNGSRNHSSTPNNTLPLMDFRIGYLLISPLLPPVAGFITMFSSPDFRLQQKVLSGGETGAVKRYHSQDITQFPCCIIFGSKDMFTSSKKLRKWAEDIAGRNKKFLYHEVIGAGHFWHEPGVERKLRDSVRQWIEQL